MILLLMQISMSFIWAADDRQVRLTYDRPSQVGWIFSRLPLTATNFEVQFLLP